MDADRTISMEDTPEARWQYSISTTVVPYEVWLGLKAQPAQWMPRKDEQDVLAVLAASPHRMVQAAIAHATYLNVQTVRKILIVLETKGFVHQPLGKRKGYCLTSAGKDFVNKS
jgi:predicted transcriptional regulator